MKTITHVSDFGITSESRILALYPHPDDETGASGGLLFMAAREGVDITLVTLTNGEKSTLRHGLKKDAVLEIVRKRELLKAAGVLGIGEVILGHFPDGELPKYEEDITSFITPIIEGVDPTHILTFEPDGVYGHVDHISLSKLVAHIAKEKEIPLIYATIETAVEFHMELKELTPHKANPLKPNLRLVFDQETEDAKVNAIKQHCSQFLADNDFFEEWERINILHNEFYFIDYL
jgi:LmbE family N-acetylglucosaminyl deacetylase